MKNQFLNLMLIALLSGAIMTSCNNDDDDSADQDVNKPVISDAHVENHEHGGKVFNEGDEKVHAGEEGAVHFKLTDDKALGSWKIDIHDAFDGHGHGKVFDNFTIIQSGEIGGTQQEVEVDLGEIPADATAGEYHCVINATDAAGNSADFEEVLFVLSNGTEPQLTITAPLNAEGETHMDKGSSFDLFGTLTDDTGIKSLEIFITEEGDDHDHEHGKLLDEDHELFDKDDFADNMTSYDLAGAGTMTIPADFESGHFIMKFVSEDADGNYMIEKFEIHID